MPEIKRGGWTLNLGVFQLSAEVSEEDRQCAWELYTELCTRLAMVGKLHDETCSDFSGEVLVESLDSMYHFFQEARGIMRKFPVGHISIGQDRHLGLLINELIVHVLRPFLEKWQANFRHWWKNAADESMSPFELQQNYPQYKEFTEDWTNVRLLVRELMDVLAGSYQLLPLRNR